MEAKDKVLEVLNNSDQPLSAGQITEISGLDRKEVDKAMKTLKDEERIVSPKRCYWQPKK
ncbi:MAG: MarR family transcriptional regulator [Chlorobiaceae bacterium]|nr:MarR family transcriptional regulator [Chlorobiaceae bacterium]NTV61408.1 MarR family transcriptional regulator [Chlorobiaceae bacterium]